MTSLEMLIQRGSVIDFIIGFMVLEAVAIALWYYIKNQGIAPSKMVGNFVAGLFLLLALRSALQGGSAMSIGMLLLFALCGHLGDLASRWSRRKDNSGAVLSRFSSQSIF